MRMIILVLCFSALLYGCQSKTNLVNEINVYKMISFLEADENSLITFTDEASIKQMTKAIDSAKKEPGVVDMADPHFKIEIGDDSYFLWYGEAGGTGMDVADTHTIFTLTDKATTQLKNFFR